MKNKTKKLKTDKLANTSPFDPDGSYTGVPCDDKYETPQQDADDL